MNQTEIYNEVVTLITPFAKNQEALSSVNNESKILEDLGVNSARLVDIVLDFEEKFDIEVEDEAADGIRTIGDAVNLIHAKIN